MGAAGGRFCPRALTIALFLLNLRRTGERAGRAAERLDIWSAAMPFTARCWTRPQTALAIATLFLTACAGVGSDTPSRVCPPVVEYSDVEQARVADEVAAMTEEAVIVEWLADYTVLREQARACAGR